ncbi:hypothetical protein CCB81_05225 [Armatimonadetes bacterium Uphvl-Ar2]|nr:hypothetical protein CCB81_05225 [Armatimonadetes bacterium Uphvl-Ar2]
MPPPPAPPRAPAPPPAPPRPPAPSRPVPPPWKVNGSPLISRSFAFCSVERMPPIVSFISACILVRISAMAAMSPPLCRASCIISIIFWRCSCCAC